MITYDIMLDVDDVIFPTMESIHGLAKDAGLHDGTARMAWSGWENYTLPSGEPCPEQVYWDLWSEFALSGGYVNTPPVDGAAEAMRDLFFDGHRLHIVTARGFMNHAEDIRAWTPQWLEEWAIPHTSLTFAQNKVAAQAELGVGFDFGLDDRTKTVLELRDAGVDARLQRHQHNEGDEISDELVVYTVQEFANIVKNAALELEYA